MADPLVTSLALRRRELGLSQAELERLTGVDQGCISEVERGIRDTQVSTLRRLATALGRDIVLVPAGICDGEVSDA